MEDKHQKPLRPSSNKIKDLYNTYIKNDEHRGSSKDTNKETNENMNEKTEKELEDKIEAALNKDLNKDKQNTIENSNQDNKNQDNKNDDSLNREQSNQSNSSQSNNSQIPHELTVDIHEEILQYQKHISELEKERDTLKELLVRKTAEMENLRRRTIKEKEDLLNFGTEKLMAKFIEIPDDFGNAIDAAKKANDKDAVITGLEMIFAKINKMFDEVGVVQIPNPVGEEFNVDFHEALMTAPSEYPEGYVTQVLQHGYTLNGKVIRHTKVITSSGN